MNDDSNLASSVPSLDKIGRLPFEHDIHGNLFQVGTRYYGNGRSFESGEPWYLMDLPELWKKLEK